VIGQNGFEHVSSLTAKLAKSATIAKENKMTRTFLRVLRHLRGLRG